MSDRCSSLPSPTVSAWSCHGAISGKCCFAPWGNFVPPKNYRAFGSGPPIPFIQIPNSTRSQTLHTINYTIAQQLGWERIGGTFSVLETETQVPLLTWHWQKEGDTGRNWQSAAATGIQWPAAREWVAHLGCWKEPQAVCGAGMGPSSKGGILSCGKQHSQGWVQDPAQPPRLKAAGWDSGSSAEAVGWGREEGCNSSQLLSVNLFGLRKNYRESWRRRSTQDL